MKSIGDPQVNESSNFEEIHRVLREAKATAGVLDARLLLAAANQLVELNYDKQRQLELIVDIIRTLYVSASRSWP
jgi:hypothetical protein